MWYRVELLLSITIKNIYDFLKENLKKAQSDHSEARDTHQAQLKKVQDDLAETQKKRQAASEKFEEDTAALKALFKDMAKVHPVSLVSGESS